MARIVRQEPMLESMFQALLPTIFKLQRIVPCEIQTIFITQDLTANFAAEMKTMEEYRTATLTIGRDFYAFNEIEQKRDLTHEMIHTLVEPLTRVTRSTLGILRDEYKLASVAVNVFKDEDRRACERVVCDLTEILFPLLFPEHAGY